MAGQASLPHVSIVLDSGMVRSVKLDGESIKGVQLVAFEADVHGGYPRVTLQLWATVELTGEVAVTARQERSVARCTRPHRDEAATDSQSRLRDAPESFSERSGAHEGIPDARELYGEGVPITAERA